MAVIGSYGEVVFEVSPKKMLSFSELEKNNRSRWAEHEIQGQKAKLEFEGAGLDDLKYKLLLRAENGINPMKEMAKLEKMNDRGMAAHFILGNKPIAPNKFVITELSEALKNIDQLGNILSAEVTVSLKEYVEGKVQVKKTTSNTKLAPSTVSSKPKVGTMTITVKSVHIRSGPGANHKIIGYAMKGDKFTVLDEKNGWYSLGGGKYITASGQYSSLKKG
ncbi:p2 family protein [Bacillus sp. OxB-1]|uniref:phage tail protein n=1 Tax=Bacillus sp. (strain OxB-1) TaxID=98228 RepID=UPI000581CCC4|nr:phage tail protein [Bacillus sp. OxB-1]BAQ11439.1 p2 family protein [Bacillus sp. OxB-1]